MQAINSEVAAVVAGKPKQLLILRKLYGSLKIVMVNLKVEDQFFFFLVGEERRRLETSTWLFFTFLLCILLTLLFGYIYLEICNDWN